MAFAMPVYTAVHQGLECRPGEPYSNQARQDDGADSDEGERHNFRQAQDRLTDARCLLSVVCRLLSVVWPLVSCFDL